MGLTIGRKKHNIYKCKTIRLNKRIVKENMKTRKHKMFFSLIMACLVFNSVLITEVFAVTTIDIQKPSSGQNYNDLLNHEYIEFYFRIFGGYESYSTFIDGQYDSDLKHVGVHIYYDVNLFISRYGRGTHTFTVTAKASGLVPLGMIEGERGSTIVESVEFEVNPVLCHFVGFGYDDDPSLEYWQSNVLPLRDLLKEPGYAYYIPGYSYYSFSWNDDDVDDKIRELDEYETSDDVVVVLISSHGSETYGIKCTYGWFGNHWLKPSELASPLSVLDSNNLIVIVSSCHSGIFIDELSQLSNNHHIMTSCRDYENSHGYGGGYESWWSIEVKIDNVASYFPRFLFKALLGVNSTFSAFLYAYSETVAARPQGDQHPQDHYNLAQSLYLVG
jgi:hypothetical protein